MFFHRFIILSYICNHKKGKSYYEVQLIYDVNPLSAKKSQSPKWKW